MIALGQSRFPDFFLLTFKSLICPVQNIFHFKPSKLRALMCKGSFRRISEIFKEISNHDFWLFEFFFMLEQCRKYKLNCKPVDWQWWSNALRLRPIPVAAWVDNGFIWSFQPPRSLLHFSTPAQIHNTSANGLNFYRKGSTEYLFKRILWSFIPNQSIGIWHSW